MPSYTSNPIIDPDNLNDGTEIIISVINKTIQLIVTGNLSTDGVTLQCVYSKLKELWKSNDTYIKYPFPMEPLTEEKFEIINGWDFADNTSKNLIRTGGWALKDLSGNSQEEWAGIITLGSLGSTDQVYFQQILNGDSTNIVLTGPVNQAVKIYGDSSHGDFDYRSYFKVFAREYQKSYATSQLSDIGVNTLTYQVYRFPLANTTDLKITHDDSVMTTSPYSGMSLTWYTSAQQRSIGGINRDFHIIIDGNNGTAEQIYEFVQYSLRQSLDIDGGSGTKIGKTSSDILKFIGDTLYTLIQSEGGVYIDNYQTTDINRLFFVDDSGVNRSFPYVAVLTINFGDNLKNDNDAIYRVFFSENYGESTALLVQDNYGSSMSGNISGSSSISKTFDYDSNDQGGRTPGTDANIVAVGIGLTTATFVKATGTISRSNSNSISLVSNLERVYKNS